MTTSHSFGSTGLLLAGILVLANCSPSGSETSGAFTAGENWPMYRGNLAGTGYSSLTQISPSNVTNLVESWSFSLRNDEADNPREPNSQATPIVVDGIMYLPTVDSVVALEPTTGQEIWRHAVSENAPSRRGVSHWAGDQDIPPRIFFTAFDRLVALDAATGEIALNFGQSGEIDLVTPYISVPMVYDNIIVVGANTPRGAIGGIGNARAFDAISGEKVWEFSSVPQPGSIGHDTWEGDSWVGRLGANAWPFYFTVDAERDLLYIPLASPIPFGYGGDRGGSNLFANSIVAVDIHSGEYVWHFQTIHHDLWDHDPPAPPALFNTTIDGETAPALGVTTKSGYLYLLNRETGEPLFGVEERPVAQSTVPGEETFATQPIPVKPPPIARVSFSPFELVTALDTSAVHATACARLVANIGEVYNAGPFTPWTYRPTGSNGPTTLLFPGLVGGPNWGGVAHDANSGLVFVFSTDIGTFGWMEDAEAGSGFLYTRGGPRPAGFSVNINNITMPCQKPPWSHLTAVDTTTGDIAWRIPLGITEGLSARRQNTGRPGRAAALVTANNLLFIASTDDNRLRALSATSGDILWEQLLERRGNANPMTYMGNDDKQYVVIAASDKLVGYSLP